MKELKSATAWLVDRDRMMILEPEPNVILDFLHHADRESPILNVPVTCQEKQGKYYMIVSCPCCPSSFTMLVDTPFEIEWLTYVLGETAQRVHYINERLLTHGSRI